MKSFFAVILSIISLSASLSFAVPSNVRCVSDTNSENVIEMDLTGIRARATVFVDYGMSAGPVVYQKQVSSTVTRFVFRLTNGSQVYDIENSVFADGTGHIFFKDQTQYGFDCAPAN